MAKVIVSPAAADALARLILTHSLPADTKERVRRSAAPLAEFPRLGRELEGDSYVGLRFLLGPWRWLVIVYAYETDADEVWILTFEDARASTAVTNYRG
ncbi:MAG TPA: type II toxin-antitoxin system RelE/ParE family toxin [Gaiellaceae bacterium]